MSGNLRYMKTCSECNQEKEEVEFYQVVPGRLRSNCKSCHKQKMRPRSKEHYTKNKDYYKSRNKKQRRDLNVYIKSLKSRPCADCQKTFLPWVMQFDHVEGVKKYNVSMMATLGSQKLIDLEVAKCEVVCANCHANRTYQRSKKE